MAKVKITQVRSLIGRPLRQKNTVRALGITRLGLSATHEATPQILGMIAKVAHVLKVEEVVA
jgi:large subunit ribosomal protein L30